MAVDVTSPVRMMNGCKEEKQQHLQQQKMIVMLAGVESDGGEGLMTRDLLGNNNSRLGSKDLDLDLQVPLGWEKHLDLKSGKVYIQRCNSPPMSSSSITASSEHDQNHRQLQDLNFPPPSSKNMNVMIEFEDDTTLELKLFLSSSSSSSSTTTTSSTYHNYRNQSVCTLDKVKSALDRAEKEKKKPTTLQFDLSSSSSNKEDEDGGAGASSSGPMFAAGCPACLLYVLISKTNPVCPRCNSIVPVPTPLLKKPRIDLNPILM